MKLTEGALKMLMARYKAVLRKCGKLNLLGGLLLAGALTLGGVVSGQAQTVFDKDGVADDAYIGSTTYTIDKPETLYGSVHLYGTDVNINEKGSISVPKPEEGQPSPRASVTIDGNNVNIHNTSVEINTLTLNQGTLNLFGTKDKPANLSLLNNYSALRGGMINVPQNNFANLIVTNLVQRDGELLVDGDLNLTGLPSETQMMPDNKFQSLGGKVTIGSTGKLNVGEFLSLNMYKGELVNNGGSLILNENGHGGTVINLYSGSAQDQMNNLLSGKTSLIFEPKDYSGSASINFYGSGDITLPSETFVTGSPDNGRIKMSEYTSVNTDNGIVFTSETGKLNLGPRANLSAGSMTIPESGMTLESGNLSLTSTAGISGGKLNLNSDDSYYSLSLSKSSSDPDTLISGTTANINNIITAQKGGIYIEGGYWKLNEGAGIDVQKNAFLDISGGTLDITQGSLKSAADGFNPMNSDSNRNGVILNSGTLLANVDQILKTNNGAAQNEMATGMSKISLSGVLALNGVKDRLSNLKNYTNYVSSNSDLDTSSYSNFGHVSFINPVIYDSAGKAVSTVSSQDLQGWWADMKGINATFAVSDNAVNIIPENNDESNFSSNVGIGIDNIILTGANATTATINVGSGQDDGWHPSVILYGKGGDNALIQTENGQAAKGDVYVTGSSVLQLGSQYLPADTQGGKLEQNIILNNYSTLRVAGRSFSLGAIDSNSKSDNNYTTVSVQDGAEISASSIGATNGVYNINTSGKINSAGPVKASNIHVNGEEAQLIASTINANYLSASNKSTVEATNGDINVVNSIAVDRSLIKASKDIIAKSIYSIGDQYQNKSYGGHGTLEAGGNIKAGNIHEQNVYAGKNIVTTSGGITALNRFDPETGEWTRGTVKAGGNIYATPTGDASADYGYMIQTTNLIAGGEVVGSRFDISDGGLTAKRLVQLPEKNPSEATGFARSIERDVYIHGATLNLSGTGDNASVLAGNLILTQPLDGSSTLGDMSIGYTMDLDRGAVSGGKISTTNAWIHGGAAVTFDQLTLTGGQSAIERVLMIGQPFEGSDDPAHGSLDVNKLNLDGGFLVMGSEWGHSPAQASVQQMNNGANGRFATNGNILLLGNSMLALGNGANMNWLAQSLQNATGYSSPENGKFGSVIGIYQPLEISQGNGIFSLGSISMSNIIDASIPKGRAVMPNLVLGVTEELKEQLLQATPGLTIEPGENMLVVSANAAKVNEIPEGSDEIKQGAISYAGTNGIASIASGSKLLITEAQPGEEYVILGEGFNTEIDPFEDDTAWGGENLMTDNPLVQIDREPGAEPGVFRATSVRAADIFPSLDGELASVLDNAMMARQIGTSEEFRNTGSKGTQFLSRALYMASSLGGNDSEGAATTIEGAARMVTLGAVPQMTLAANTAAGAAITQRTSLAQPSSLQVMDETGNVSSGQAVRANSFALWVMPLYQSTNGFGMEAGNYSYDFSGALGGVALGADYTWEDCLRAGISFNIGGGYARGTGDFNETTNNMNFWGLGAYVGWSKNNFGLTADVNYTSAYNELKQDLPADIGWDELKSDLTSWAISTGLRAEYKINTAYLDITPHVGFRFTNLNVDSYDINNGGAVIEGDSMTQNIWTFPIGVTLDKSFAFENGWHIMPKLDLNVTPATGNIKAKSNIRFTGTGTEAELDTKMMDYITYGGTFGVEFGNENFSVGINYNGQFGAESSAHGIFGTLRYEF